MSYCVSSQRPSRYPYPAWRDLEDYTAWQRAAARQHATTGWHPVWLAQAAVEALTVSTVFLTRLMTLDERPFETWVRGSDRDDFTRYATAQAAVAGHWCLVWQFHEEARDG